MAGQSRRRVVGHHGWQEDRDGGHRCRARRICHCAHARQLEDLPRRGGHRHVCGLPAHDGRAPLAVRRDAVGRSHRAPRLRRAAHHRRRPAHPHELGRATAWIRHQGFDCDHLRRSHDALERRHPGPLRRLSPAAPHGRRGRLPGRGVPRPICPSQRRRRLLGVVRVAVLYRRHGLPVPAPRSRRLELRPDSRVEQRQAHIDAPNTFATRCTGRVCRLHLRPRCRR